MNKKNLLFSILLLTATTSYGNIFDDIKEAAQETIDGIKECYHVAADEFKSIGLEIGAEIHEIKETTKTTWKELTQKEYNAVIVTDLELVKKAKEENLFVAKIDEEGKEKFVIVFDTKERNKIIEWLKKA